MKVVEITDNQVLKSTESEKENQTKNGIFSFIKGHKKIAIGVLVLLGVLLAVYIGMTIYFMNHFYYGSTINKIDISGKSVEEVNELMATELKEYKLTLVGRSNTEEQITAEQIDLRYDSGSGFEDSKEKQKPYRWIISLFNKEYAMIEGVKYDEKLLLETVDNLACFDTNNVVEPKSPTFEYADNSYEIVPEVDGNKVQKDILLKHIQEAVIKGEDTIDLEAIDCYYKPEYTTKSKEVVDAYELLNKYVSTKITYDFESEKEFLDGSIINNWITFNDKYEVTLDEGKIRSFVAELGSEYNTVGKQRDFKTSDGVTVKVGGGDYGWGISVTNETKALVEAVKNGETVTKQPAFYKTAMALGKNDIGDTYVEINLTSQHLWFYKNGSLVVEGPVVTGNVSTNNSTPAGIYSLKYKQKNAVLHGEDYETPVDYWMPFNGNIGIHNASWRSEFGGTIYQTSGSHGCVNAPYDLAQAVYNNISAGTPVVCYH